MAEYEAKRIYVVKCPAQGCPAPGKVKRDGFQNDQQRYECNGCGNKFHAEGKALHKQFPADQIADAIDMYYSGMSYKQVAENMEDTLDVPEPSKATVHDWVKGYTRLAKRVLDGKAGEDGTGATASGKRVQANVSGDWAADEMVVRVGGRKLWNWNVIDKKTKYILASRISHTRGENDARALFEEASRNTKVYPKTITTDGLSSYPEGIKATFPKAEHIVADGIYEPVNNNISERLQGSFRQRIKTQRGLQMRKTAQDYLDGWVIDYNFMKKHRSLGGKTPAEVTGVAEQVPWDSWEDITRIGGEVAEVEVKETTPKPKKPGPKPGFKAVQEAVVEYLKAQEIKKAHEKRKGRKSQAVSAYHPTKRKTGKGGRGEAEIVDRQR